MKLCITQPLSLPEEILLPLSATIRRRGLSFEQISKDLKTLWPILASDLGQKNKNNHYADEERFTLAYAAYYLPANILKIPIILSEAQYYGIEFPKNWRWLDLGSGPGTAVLGAMLWKDLYSKVHSNTIDDQPDSYLSVDQSKYFLEIHKELVQNYFNQKPSVEYNHSNYLDNDTVALINKFKPTVVSFANTLVETSDDTDLDKKQEYVESVCRTLITLSKADGQNRFLIMMEPGSKKSSRSLLSLKNKIFQNNQNGHVLLPCTDNRACGALDRIDDWCHEAVSCEFPEWHTKLGEKAGLKKEQLLFSYLLWSTNQPNQWIKNSSRVVSQRLEEKGLTKCFLCTSNGKKQVRVRHSKVTDDNKSFLTIERGTILKSIDYSEKGDVIAFEQL